MDPRPYHYEYRKPRLSNPTYKSDHLYESIYHIGAFGTMYRNVEKVPNNNYELQNIQYSQPNRQQDQQRQRKIRQQIRKIDPYIQQPIVLQRNRQQANNFQSMKMRNNLDRNQYYHKGANHKQQVASFTPPKVRAQMQYNPHQASQKEVAMQRERNNVSSKNGSESSHRNYPRSYSQQVSTGRKQDQGYLSNYGSRLMQSFVRGDQDFVYERQQKPYNIINCYPKEVVNTHRAFPKYTLQNRLLEHGQYPRLYNPEH